MALIRCRPLALLLVAVAGCTTSTAITQRETIDDQTGTTVSHLDAPIQLLATTPGAPSGDPFAFVAPFETDRMGVREIYLWVAVPGEGAPTPKLVLTLDGEPLTLAQVSVNPTALGLRTLPYRMPAPWSAVFIYRLDARTLRSLESAHNLTIGAQYARSGTLIFAGDWDGSGAIAAFRRGIGLAD